jgi:hypothetical protein
MFKNWKTTLSGLGSLVTGIIAIANGNLGVGIGLIMTGITGFAAKDSTTHSTTTEVKKADAK